MSLQSNMTEPSLVNGLPPSNFGKNSAMSNVPLNGVDSSPVHRVHQIPVSQLPPMRSSIPSSQLPPSSNASVQENLKQITQNYGHLNISQVTPISSPKVQSFGTSTPLLPQQNSNDSPVGEYSPVSNSVGSNSSGTNSHAESLLENVQLTANIKNLNRQNHENNNLEQINQFNSKQETSRNNEATKNVNLPYSSEKKSVPSVTYQPIQRVGPQQPIQPLGLKQGVPEASKQRQNFSTMPSNPSQDFDLMTPQTQAFHQKREEQQVPNFQSQNVKPPTAFHQPSAQKREELQNFSYFQGQPQSAAQQFNLPQQQQPRPQLTNQKSGPQLSNQKPEEANFKGIPPVLQPSNFQANQPSNLKPAVPRFPPNQNVPPLRPQFSQQPQSQQELKQAPPQFSNFPVPLSQPQQELKQGPSQFSNFPQSQPHQELKQAPPAFMNFPVPLSQPQQEFKQAPPTFSNFPVPLSQPQQEFKQAPPQFSNFPVLQSQPPQELKPAPPPQFSNFSVPQSQPNLANLPQNIPKQLPPVPQQQQQSYPFQYPPQNHGQANQPPPMGMTRLPPQSQGPPKVPNLPANYQPSSQLPQKQEAPPPAFQPPQQISDSSSITYKTNLHANRYPTFQPQQTNPPGQFSNNLLQPQQQQPTKQNVLSNLPLPPLGTNNPNDYANYNKSQVVQGGFSKMWGHENIDLLQCPTVLPPFKIEAPRVSLGQELLDSANCSPDIFRCTMTKIPETSTLLQKSRLPLGVLIHPFKDLDHLPVIQCSTIVRCRACRTYINPFVFFIDMKRWKCNLCYRVNELPEEFQFDPVSKTYGDPSRRPEIKSSTIEYIAPSEYMLRPPQPAVYIFLLDVSRAAIDSGYLHSFCSVLKTNLDSVPGDGRTQVGFIAFNSAIHFYSFADGLNRPHEMTMLDIDDIFLPCPDNLVVNLNEHKELIMDLLSQLPDRFNNSYDTGSALGAALQIGHKLISNTGGRITVFQSGLPNCGPGKLISREDPNQRSGSEVQHLNPANDFYKRLALDCSGQQIAVDLFVLNSQYVDLATISGISKFSGGSIHHYPLFKASRVVQAENFERCLKRYLTRKIGFEAVMRVRCTRGLSIHTFHGNFFVRSTDLLSLPNVNPEAGFGMQVSIDESLADLHTVCFQAALLYTSSKGERRIRVHTLCLPIANNLPDVLAAADQQCIIGVLAKMAVDRSVQSSLADSREAFINVAVDILSSYKLSLNLGNNPAALVASHCLQLLPLYISALLKHLAFRTGISTRLDDRVKAMCDMKTLPLYLLIQQIYPDLYPVHNLEDQNTTLNVDGEAVPQPGRLQLSARCLDSKSAFLLDMGENMILMVCPNVSASFLNDALGVPDYNSISEQMYDLPILNTPQNLRLNNFINSLNDEKPFPASLHIIRENSQHRNVFIERLIEDRIETALSYHEFLQHLKTQVK